jgi:hypothetical protein
MSRRSVKCFEGFLERAGFSLLVAEDGQEALRIASEYPDRIDLLVSECSDAGADRTGSRGDTKTFSSRSQSPVRICVSTRDVNAGQGLGVPSKTFELAGVS